jgi:pimeloyl-ACP methyl ester carboxylesterase
VWIVAPSACLLACLAAACVSGQPRLASAPQETLELHSVALGEGEPILLLHGFGGSLYTWRHIQAELGETHRVILLDLKGHGESPKPRDGRYGVLDQVELVRRFIVKHDLRNLTLVGNSYGGGVALVTALELSRDDPGRLDRLVLLDTAAYRQRLPFHLALLRFPEIGPLSLELLSPLRAAKMVLEKTFYDDREIPADAVSEYARWLRASGGKYALVQTARQVVPSNIDSIAGSYPTLTVPTLIVWGRDDELIPLRLGRRLQKELPNARLRIIPACGHAPQEECPEELLPLIQAFLRSTESGR